jgi:hypothetical protein
MITRKTSLICCCLRVIFTKSSAYLDQAQREYRYTQEKEVAEIEESTPEAHSDVSEPIPVQAVPEPEHTQEEVAVPVESAAISPATCRLGKFGLLRVLSSTVPKH